MTEPNSVVTAGMAQRIARRLSSRRVTLVVALLATLLALPSLGIGWIADDYPLQLSMMPREGVPQRMGTPWNPFRFWDGDPEHNQALMDLGVAPWWTHPDVKAVFWRPLAVVFHRIDYALWPTSPVLMHVQSLAWFGLAVGLVAILYRRIEGTGWTAGLAALLFAVEDAHATPAAWIANRSTLIAAVFGVLAILAHHRWRNRGSYRWLAAGCVCLALSLLAKEEGLCTTAYVFAYALFIDRGPWRTRTLSLLPYAALVLIWRATWRLVGAGMANVGLYVDPISDPVRFAANVIEWLPPYLLGQFAAPPPDINILISSHGANPILWWSALAFVVAVTAVMWPYLRRDRIAGFYATGMLLSFIPICAGLPGDRLLFFASIGAFGLLGRFALAWVTARPRNTVVRDGSWVGHADPGAPGEASPVPPRPEVRRVTRTLRQPANALIWTFAVFHIGLAPVLLAARSFAPLGPPSVLRQVQLRIPAEPNDGENDIIVVNAPSTLFTAYVTVMRILNDQPIPRSVRVISPGMAAVKLSRPDDRTLVIRPTPSYLATQMDQLFRPDDATFRVGDEVQVNGMRVVVTELDAHGRPSEARFHFDTSLDDPAKRWFQWKDGEFVPFTTPRIGETIDLPAPIPKLF